MTNSEAKERFDRRWVEFFLTLAGLILASVGYWGPWVDHVAAALAIPGFDLAEYVKFLPEVRAGTISIARELFYLPALAIGLCLALTVGRSRRWLPAQIATSLAILAAWLALVVAPPIDLILRFSQDAVLRAEWGRQAALAAAAFLAVAAAALWADHLPHRTMPFLTTLITGAGAAIPLWQFADVRPAIERVYNKPLTLGWGLVLMPLGLALVAFAAWWQAPGGVIKEQSANKNS